MNPLHNPLRRLLRQRIAAAGPIPVAAFMEAALLHPEHGYYRCREAIGRAGDFVTAPEISQVFGELLGAWCVEVWQQQGAAEGVTLAELGPGRGTLLTDLLRTTCAVAPAFTAALRVHLVEASPVLRAVQRQRLAALSPPHPPPHSLPHSPTWHPDTGRLLAALPERPLLLLANEFLDALPIRQFVRHNGRWCERMVGLDAADEDLAFVAGPPVAAAEDAGSGPPEGTIRERCPEGEALIAALAARLAAHGGAALLIDYGPAASDDGDTLQAVAGHRPVDPLADPGRADLSHHVDFAPLRERARAAGAAVWGPLAQGLFLGRLGAAERAEALAAAAASDAQAQAILGAVRRLLHPGRMGVLFKAMAITPMGAPPPPGFTARPAGGGGLRRT